MSGSGRGSAGGSRSFDFGTDDVLCSYDDFAAPCEPKRPDPADKDFHDSRYGRSSVKVYEQESYAKEDVLSAVEKCMKKYADNLLRSLEGITNRLSQLEIYCYKLERSIGELRSDVLRDETDLRLKSLEKHLHEVHRSIQILRDKQELVETQKELAKFQLTQDESKKKEDVPTPSFPEPRKLEEKPDTAGQQLALVLPHQVNSSSLAPRASEPVQQYKDQPVQQTAPSSLVPQQDRYVLSQAIVYYPQHQNPGIQDTQGQQAQPGVQYLPVRTQAQDVPVHASSQEPESANQTQLQSYPPYQQQWNQQSSQSSPGPVAQPQQTFSQPFSPPVQQPQLANAQQFPTQAVQQSQLSNAQQFPPPQVQSVQQSQLPNAQQFPPQQVQPQQPNPHLPQTMQPQHPPVQTQMRPQTPPNYSRYPPHQSLHPAPETLPGSAPMQGPYNTVAPSGGSRSEVQYSYGGPGIAPSQPPPQHNMQRQQLPPPSQGSFGPPPSAYASPPQYAPQGHSQGYNTAYSYPPSGPSAVQAPQMPPGGVGMSHPGSSHRMMRGHPYGEMVEKAITMGYPRDQVLNVIQRMTESGQPIDFNALLDRLNEAGSGAPPRAW